MVLEPLPQVNEHSEIFEKSINLCIFKIFQNIKEAAASVGVIALLRYRPVFTSNKAVFWIIICMLFAESHFKFAYFLLHTNEPVERIVSGFPVRSQCSSLFLWHFYLYNQFNFFIFFSCISLPENPFTSFYSLPPSGHVSPSAAPSLRLSGSD